MTFTSLSCSGSPPASFFSFLVKSSGMASHRKAMRLPSGDHTGSPTPRGMSVKVHASPPPSDSSASCEAGGFPSFGGSLPRTKTIHLPSGDQRGSESCLPLVRRRGADDPSVATVHNDVSYPSFLSLTFTLTNTTCDPSGETCGSPIHWKRNRSFSVMGRLVWEKTGQVERTRRTATKKQRRTGQAPRREGIVLYSCRIYDCRACGLDIVVAPDIAGPRHCGCPIPPSFGGVGMFEAPAQANFS